MTTFSADTSPDVGKIQIERLRQMPPWRRMALVGDMNRTLRAFALAGLRQRYPGDTPGLLRRLADLLLGSELAPRVYGPVPEDTWCWQNRLP